MNRYNAQILNDKGEYHLQFETNIRDNFNAMEKLAQKFMDKKPRTNFDRITENEGVLAEHMVHLCYETYYDCNRCEMDSRPYYTTVTGACYYTKEGAIQHTIEWLQKEAENG